MTIDVTLSNSGIVLNPVTTGADGSASLGSIPVGAAVLISASGNGLEPLQQELTLPGDGVLQVSMSEKTVLVQVRSNLNGARLLSGVTVEGTLSASGAVLNPVTTGEDGSAILGTERMIPVGEAIQVSATKDGFEPFLLELTLPDDGVLRFTMSEELPVLSTETDLLPI